ncbi:MAG: hypothetical protein OGM67_07585 [Oscillospiraceae bacterium]|nr:MAG: hypothetical protein OGM67_07585 [Oscillospiraceae bacterium]
MKALGESIRAGSVATVKTPQPKQLQEPCTIFPMMVTTQTAVHRLTRLGRAFKKLMYVSNARKRGETEIATPEMATEF